MNIDKISVSELKKDLLDSKQDIINCNLSLMQGVTTYGDGESVNDRITDNKRFIKIITKELIKRGEL